MRGPHVIREIATPGRADSAGQPETIVLHFIQARARHHTANLGLFAEGEQVRQDVEMLTAPVFSGDTHAALDFVEDEQYFIFVADGAEGLQKLTSKMIVASFALDWLNNDRGYVGAFLSKDLSNLFFSQLLFSDYVLKAFLG